MLSEGEPGTSDCILGFRESRVAIKLVTNVSKCIRDIEEHLLFSTIIFVTCRPKGKC